MSELDAEYEKTRAQVAEYLREFADELDARSDPSSASDAGDAGRTGRDVHDTGDRNVDAAGSADDVSTRDATVDPVDQKVTLVAGNDSATINPPETLGFDVEVNSDSSLMEAGEEHSVRFTLRWQADDVARNDDLDVK